MKLTDKQRKQIVAEYVSGGTSTRKLAEKYGVTNTAIEKVLNTEESRKEIEKKKEENTKSILEFMDGQKAVAQSLISEILSTSKEQIKEASLRDKMGTLKILSDVFSKIPDKSTSQNNLDKLCNAIMSFSERMEAVEDTDYKQEKPF